MRIVGGELMITRDMIERAEIRERDYLVLAAILLLAAVLRIIGLNAPLWHDEIATILGHLRLPWGEMLNGYEMNHHYLYSFQAKVSAGLFGESAWSVRLPAMLFGVASIAALWWLVQRISGPFTAHITALLIALSYHHIWFSQNARGYTELMFWCILGTGLFLTGVRRPSFKVWTGFALVLALAAFTHLTGIFFFATLGLIWMGWLVLAKINGGHLTRWHVLGPIGGFGGGLVLSALAYAPILTGVVSNALEVNETSAVDAMIEYQNPIWTMLETVATLGAQGPFALAVLAAILTFAFIGSVRLHRRESLISIIVFGHIFLTMAVLVTLGMRVWPRFFFVDIGLLMFLILEGVLAVSLWMGSRIKRVGPIILPTAVAGMVIVSVGLAFRNYMAPKQDLEGAVRLVEASRTDGEAVFVLGVSSELTRDFYAPEITAVLLPEDFEPASAATEPAWLIVPFPARTFRDFKTLEETIASDFEHVNTLPGTLGDGHVAVFRRR